MIHYKINDFKNDKAKKTYFFAIITIILFLQICISCAKPLFLAFYLLMRFV
ncbi:hypothetical protein FI146_840037 [Flavobacterium psychrophilum]|nr:hypothetical protein FI146_840037 [Flavobacterium psychrophilum]